MEDLVKVHFIVDSGIDIEDFDPEEDDIDTFSIEFNK